MGVGRRGGLQVLEDPDQPGERTLLVCRLKSADWLWLENNAQWEAFQELVASLDSVLVSRGWPKTLEKLPSNLRNHDILVLAKGDEDEDGNTGADVLLAVALDFLVAAKRMALGGEDPPQLQIGLASGEFSHGISCPRQSRRQPDNFQMAAHQYVFGGPVLPEARLLAREADGNSLRVSERVRAVLRPDHVARLCLAEPIPLLGGHDIPTYRLLSEDELLDRKAQNAAARQAAADAAPVVVRDRQDWLMRFRDPALENQFWLWFAQHKPERGEASMYWPLILFTVCSTALTLKSGKNVPGANPAGPPSSWASALPLAHDGLLTLIMLMIGTSPHTYNRYRQPLALAVRILRTLLLVVLQDVPVQIVPDSPLAEGFPEYWNWFLMICRGLCVGPLMYIAVYELKVVGWHLLGDGLTFLLLTMSFKAFGAPYIVLQIIAGIVVPSSLLWKNENKLRSLFVNHYKQKVGQTSSARF